MRWVTCLVFCLSCSGDDIVAPPTVPQRQDVVGVAPREPVRQRAAPASDGRSYCRLPAGGYRSDQRCEITLARHLHRKDHAQARRGLNKDGQTTVLALRKRFSPLEADYIALEEHYEPASRKVATGRSRGHKAFDSVREAVLPGVIPGNEASVRLEFQLLKGARDRIAKARHRRGSGRDQMSRQQHVGLLGIAKEKYNVAINGQRLATHKQVLTASYKQRVADRGGVIILNHPIDFFAGNADYSIAFEQAELFDAVEVFNDVGAHRFGTNARAALAWTEANFFQRGIFPAVVSGHDDHGPYIRSMKGPRWPSMLKILTPNGNTTETAAIVGIRERATYVAQRPTLNNKKHKRRNDFAPETTMEFVLDDGIGLGAQGLSFAGGSQHQLKVRLDHLPPFSKVELVYNGRSIRAVDLPRGGPAVVAATFSAEAGAVHPGTGRRLGYVYAKVTVKRRPNVPKPLQSYFRDRLYLCTSPVPFVVL